MTRCFRQLIAMGAALLGLAAIPAHAAVLLFQDNFDTDNATSVLNFNAFNNWTVSGGTVDYIRQGDFGISCFGGTGGCVDLDGSTFNGGRMTSKTSFTLLPNETYELVAQVSGNQRGGSPDSFFVGLTDGPSTLIFGQPTLAPNAPFALLGSVGSPLQIIGGGSFSNVQIFIDTPSADNVGVIVDNVALICVTCQTNQVPEPGSLALLGLGLIGALGFARTRS